MLVPVWVSEVMDIFYPKLTPILEGSCSWPIKRGEFAKLLQGTNE